MLVWLDDLEQMLMVVPPRTIQMSDLTGTDQ
jgi:hypothetical protein